MPPSVTSEASSDGHTFVPFNENTNTSDRIAREHGAAPCDIQRLIAPALPYYSGSPLSRAGLLNPVPSHANSASAVSGSFAARHSQNDIRAHTMQLSGVPVSFARPSFTGSVRSQPPTPLVSDSEALMMRNAEASTPSFIFPQPSESVRSLPLEQPRERAETPSSSSFNLTESTSTLDARPSHPPPQSNLSILMARHGSRSPSQERADENEEEDDTHTPVISQTTLFSSYPTQHSRTPPLARSTTPLRSLTERTPLLPQPSFQAAHRTPHKWVARVKSTTVEAVRALPAVVLGLLLNVLDGISYGMIIFPASGVFMNLGAMGVSMFFISTIVSQLVYSAGASGFASANGSMMIEVVDIGEENPREIVATTLVAFAFSSVLTGLTFFLLGFFRLGSLIGFFPRHILVGCIGGVGVFLIITGLNVSTRLQDDDFTLSLDTLLFFLRSSNLALWAPAFALAALLRVITSRWRHQLILPTYFLIIPIVFYLVILTAGVDLVTLRKEGWLFEVARSEETWYRFYTYFDLAKTKWGPLWATLPTQFALLFFNVLHPPLNVPALAVSLDLDVDTNKELIAHGYSNFLAGVVGTVPNYLVYVNTLLFHRVGGTTRLSGFMLAGATFVVLLAGTGPIAYIPVMVVSALIFVLGIDLVKEALWDTRHRVSKTEYITIASIMVAMTVWDFVIGVLFGIIVSCFFFVVQNSQRRSIRVMHTGETTLSTVRRPSAHRAYLREVSQQTTILHLQGFLFFGTITHVEETIRALVAEPAWVHAPIRFLVLDFALVFGVDLSAAEAFVRVQRLLSGRKVVLVGVGQRGLIRATGRGVVSTFNDAMEWTENVYLRAWFDSNSTETKPVALPGRQDSVIMMDLQESLPHSPRRAQLRDAGWRIMANEPLNTLEQAFSSYAADRAMLEQLAPYFERVTVPAGHVLWGQGDAADGLYIIGAGVLRATYCFAAHTPAIEESMVPGTLAGELSGLSGLARNATVVAERPAVLWRLGADALRRLETERPDLARTFTALVLKAAKLDFDILLSALATRQ
ncbi:sulfate transporter family-domain-containing protein [Multifurca ochricompacta]|uniref:Sulfate transporter family-domain-containing protein n=1 Tax=Multifurca ochricompacta TaxID=376703 RepID=A0AAD4M3N9_9AGAM|nr:sulfate transporter family-domain-containing protein [Multifurca ochricompacta]